MARIIFILATMGLFFYGGGKFFARSGEFAIAGAVFGVIVWGLLYAFGNHSMQYEQDKELQRKANKEIIKKRTD